MEHIFGQNNNKASMTIPQMGSLPVITCSKCGGIFFENAFLLRVLSSIVSPDGQEHIIPEPIFRCTSCHTVVGTNNDQEQSGEENSDESEQETESDKSLLDVEEGDEDKPKLKLV